jgi:hypothetical protein
MWQRSWRASLPGWRPDKATVSDVYSSPPSAGDSDAPDSDLIGSDEVVYRLLFPDWVSEDKITGDRRPGSGAFEPDEDGVSVYREAVIIGQGLSLSDLTQNPGDPVVSFTVGDVRGVGQELGVSLDVREKAWPTDVPDPDHPKHAAHALIVGLGELGSSRQLRARRALAKVPSMKFVQP